MTRRRRKGPVAAGYSIGLFGHALDVFFIGITPAFRADQLAMALEIDEAAIRAAVRLQRIRDGALYLHIRECKRDVWRLVPRERRVDYILWANRVWSAAVAAADHEKEVSYAAVAAADDRCRRDWQLMQAGLDEAERREIIGDPYYRSVHTVAREFLHARRAIQPQMPWIYDSLKSVVRRAAPSQTSQAPMRAPSLRRAAPPAGFLSEPLHDRSHRLRFGPPRPARHLRTRRP